MKSTSLSKYFENIHPPKLVTLEEMKSNTDDLPNNLKTAYNKP